MMSSGLDFIRPFLHTLSIFSGVQASRARNSPRQTSSKLGLLFWLNENVGFLPSFSRHAKADASIALVIWLNENVGFLPSFSRHAKADASIALVIWLNENVQFTTPGLSCLWE